ncbi:ParA family protein [Bernardetia litoralis]|uniref:ParA family protein n=1 Tax=Bernardetia litoralis TaxID=999 RepID=UPI0002DC57E7|nr:AAA family ATPase [Bernardetia litoralis]
MGLTSAIGRETRLKKLLKVASLGYDYILIDMPPSLGLMQINGLNAANEIVIVCQSQPKSANGLGVLLSSIECVHEHLNAELEIKGVLITLYEKNTLSLVAYFFCKDIVCEYINNGKSSF